MGLVTKPFTVLDVFCGAGGLSLGFKQAGYTITCAIDHYPAARRTYEHNIGSHTLQVDLTNLDRSTLEYFASLAPTFIIGGPPCQGFSSAGMRQSADTRNNLVAVFAHIVATLRPQGFVFENVEGFLTTNQGKQVSDLLAPLIAAGYRIHLCKVNVANYGVPQHRKRVIAIGGLGWNPPFPNPTHTANGIPGALLALKYAPATPSIMEALIDMPTPQPTYPGNPQGHVAIPLTGKEFQRAIALKPGQTMKHLPTELQHQSYQRRAFRRVQDGTPTAHRGGAPAGIRRLKPDEPSKAITSGASAEFLHPIENRLLTLRECARLQTFPDDFVFLGSIAEQAQLIGNAVPPRFAEKIAAVLAEHMRETDCMLGEGEDGALLSFVPTLSTGYSPVLKQVTDMVVTTFMQKPAAIENLVLWD